MESVRRKLLANPRDTASSASILFFIWTIDLFKRGYQRTLQLTDLYETLPEDRSTHLGDRLERNWLTEKNNEPKPSLIKALVRTFWKKFLLLGIISFFNDIVIRLTQPYLLGRLLTYFREDSSVTYTEAIWCAAGMVILNALNITTVNQYFIGCFHAGMKIRVSLCSLIYRKTLKLSQTAVRENAVVNLLSNDVNRFDLVSVLLHYMWSAPLMAIIITIILWQEARWAGMIGLAVVFTIVTIQSCTGKLSSIFRLKTALRTDKRIKFMEEIITGVRVIKMFAWETPFGKLIDSARKSELNILRQNSYVRCLYMTFALFTTRMALFCTMLSIYLLNGSKDITASKIFVISAYLNLIAHTLAQMFVRGVAELAEAFVSVKRLQNFLQAEEMHQMITNEMKHQQTTNVDDPAISVVNLTANWSTAKKNDIETYKMTSPDVVVDATDEISLRKNEQSTRQQETLNAITLNIRKGSLVGIVGPVGAGKSSFLQALLRELPADSGSVNINGSISYACQEPWIFSASMRQNILFSNTFDERRYDKVIRASALDVDIENFDDGDMLLIGDRGISLSGGQKARVNLARCIYREADIYLFDDPLSAVDAHVGRHLFNECIGPNGFLAKNGTTRILVTHQVHFLKEADHVIVLRNGKVDFHGTPAELLALGIDFSEFLRMEISDNDDKEVMQESKIIPLKDLNVGGEEVVAQLEDTSKNKTKDSTVKTYFRSGANFCVLGLVFMLFIMTQLLASGCDYWVAVWTGKEERRQISQNNTSNVLANANYELRNDSTTNSTTTFDQLLSTTTCIHIHGTIIGALFVIALSRSVSFYTICVRASHALHNAMFKGIISTTLRFFDTNPSGRILNLFSKDLGTVDEYLPKSLLDSTQSILVMTGSVLLTLVVRPFFVIPIFLIGIVFVYVRKIYLNTSMAIKRMEGTTRSPVFTHLAATMHGLPTIRAMDAENVLTEEFDNHQDLHSSCWFMYISTNSAFGLCLDFLCFIIVSCVTFTFLFSANSHGNEVGLAITQIMALTGMLQWGVRESAEVTNHLLSVERIVQYRDLPPEQTKKNLTKVDKEWPSSGKIEFRNVGYRYSETLPPVFTNLNLSIRSNEKIGICGRTGAGKSSLIGALFRLAVVEGNIYIDGVETGSIDLYDLRSKISIIPQDPVLFSGTLRRNLDPFHKHTDADIWKALEDVELKHIAIGPLGLELVVFANGANFSVGEKQLLCLARAILQRSKILIADEATGNVSLSTDQLIQQKIREKFINCTVLTIAHRLNTIIDSDRILVMDGVRAIEFGSPHELLQNENGIFYGMVQTLGSHECNRLTKIAATKFEALSR